MGTDMPNNANPMNYGQPNYMDPNDPNAYDQYGNPLWAQNPYGMPQDAYADPSGFMPNMQGAPSPQDIYANQANMVGGQDQYGMPYGQMPDGQGFAPQDQFAQNPYGDPNQFQQADFMQQDMYGQQNPYGQPVQGFDQFGNPIMADGMMPGQQFPPADMGMTGQQQPVVIEDQMAAMGMPAGAQNPANTGGFAPQQPQQAAPAPAPAAAPSAPAADAKPIDPSKATSKKATLCLIFGVLSIIFGLLGPIGLILGIIGFKMSKTYFANGGNAASAESGRIFCIVGIVFSTLVILFLTGFICYLIGGVSGQETATNFISFFNRSPIGGIAPIPLDTGGYAYA